MFGGITTQPPCPLGIRIAQPIDTSLCTFSQRMRASVFQVGNLAKVCLRVLHFDLVSLGVLPLWAEGILRSAGCGPVTFSQQMGPWVEWWLQLGHPVIASGPHLPSARGPVHACCRVTGQCLLTPSSPRGWPPCH